MSRCKALFVALSASFLLSAVHVSAATLPVGPGQQFTKPCAAIAAAKPGDTIEIDAAGAYNGDVCAWYIPNLTLRGVNGRPKLDSLGKSADDKAIWVVGGNDTLIENIEFTGARSSNANGAGIRQEGTNVTIRNCYFHHNENGILTAPNAESTVLIEYSEFAYNGGGDGYSHNIYIGEVGKFILRYSYSHHANVGGLVKTRAISSYILYNRLTDEDGIASWKVDIPNGGLVYLIGNVIQSSRRSTNTNTLSYVSEGLGIPHQDVSRLFVVNNTFINDASEGIFLLIFPKAPQPSVIKNNLFVGVGQISTQATAVVENNSRPDGSIFLDRANYDFTLKSGVAESKGGVEPGVGEGFPLLPRAQYLHKACGQPRNSESGIAMGGLGAAGGPSTCAASPSDNKVRVKITPGTTVAKPGETQIFSAAVTGAGDTRVYWNIQGFGSQTPGTISDTGVFQAPILSTSYRMVKVVATSTADPFQSDTATIALLPEATIPLLIRVNCGGVAYQDNLGSWSGDFGYSGGIGVGIGDAQPIAATPIPAIYRTMRQAGTFSYQFLVPNGDYKIRLRFAEILLGAGTHNFDITVNDTLALKGFDPLIAAGGFYIATDQVLNAKVTNGQIVIKFQNNTPFPSIVNAIEIAPQSGVQLSLTAPKSFLTAGQQDPLKLTVKGTSNTAVTWILTPKIGDIASDGTYTAPPEVKSYGSVRVTAISAADPTEVATTLINLVPVDSNGQALMRINVGGNEFIDSLGRYWAGDSGCPSGTALLADRTSITGTITPEIYQSQRYVFGPLDCSFALPNGRYSVLLHFAELSGANKGENVVDVRAGGQTVIDNVDIAGEAGSFFVPVVKATGIEVTNNLLSLRLQPTRGRSQLSGLEIVAASGKVLQFAAPPDGPLAPSAQWNLKPVLDGAPARVQWVLTPLIGRISDDGFYTAPNAIAQPQDVTITALSMDSPGTVASTTLSLSAAAADFLPIRINLAGPTYTDSNGNVWLNDQGQFGNNSWGARSGEVIQGTAEQPLYGTGKYLGYNPAVRYTFDVPDGDYQVTLKFAELYYVDVGSRIFNILINEKEVLTNFDMTREVGARRAVDKTFIARPVNGKISIGFKTVADGAFLNGLEIIPVPAAAQ